MMKSWRFEKYSKIEDSIIKYLRNLFRFKKEIDDNTNKDLRNLFRMKNEIDDNTVKDIGNLFILKKENKPIKDRIIREFVNFFVYEEEGNYHEPIRVSNFWSNDYIESESKVDKSKALSVKKIS